MDLVCGTVGLPADLRLQTQFNAFKGQLKIIVFRYHGALWLFVRRTFHKYSYLLTYLLRTKPWIPKATWYAVVNSITTSCEEIEKTGHDIILSLYSISLLIMYIWTGGLIEKRPDFGREFMVTKYWNNHFINKTNDNANVTIAEKWIDRHWQLTALWPQSLRATALSYIFCSQ